MQEAKLAAGVCRFNEVRNNKPHLAKYRWQNIGWYFYEAMATGWMWGAKPLNRKIRSFRVQHCPLCSALCKARVVNQHAYGLYSIMWDELPELELALLHGCNLLAAPMLYAFITCSNVTKCVVKDMHSGKCAVCWKIYTVPIHVWVDIHVNYCLGLSMMRSLCVTVSGDSQHRRNTS